MLEIRNLNIKVDEKDILTDLNLKFEVWKTYFLLGKNWSWKSSLALSIAWHPRYKINSWEIILEWENIRDIAPDKRSSLWIFLSFQNVPEIPWIRLAEFLRTIYNHSLKSKDESAKEITPFLFSRFIKKHLEDLDIPESFLTRDLNVWFSWWEKRKIELLQIKLLNPKYIILDEIDSGLDIDAFKIVASSLSWIKNNDNTLIFITHNFNLMDYINVDMVHILENWRLIDSWDKELVEKIKKHWYCDYCTLEKNKCDIENKCA